MRIISNIALRYGYIMQANMNSTVSINKHIRVPNMKPVYRSSLTHKISYNYISERAAYKIMLQQYNKKYKKATKQQIQKQSTLISSILKDHQTIDKHDSQAIDSSNSYADKKYLEQIIQYLVQFRYYKFLSVSSLDAIQKYFVNAWSRLDKKQKLKCVCMMVQQSRYHLFHTYQQQRQQKQEQQKDNILQSILYNYCYLVVNKKSKISGEQLLKLASQLKEYWKKLNKQSLQRKWMKQYYLLTKYLQIKHKQNQINNNKSKIAIQLPTKQRQFEQNSHKKRSNLQIQIQTLLKVLDYEFKRQQNIWGFTVDYLITKKQPQNSSSNPNKQKQLILQVMGAYHYNIQQKLFARDILRKLILQFYAPVLFVNHNEFNAIKGMQNRIKFIQNLTQQTFTKIK